MRVQVSRRLVALVLCAGLCAVSTPRRAAAQPVDGSTVESMLRLFTDTEHVAVRSLMNDYVARLKGNSALTLHWNNERVTMPAINAPVGSPEAIDAITTASRPIAGNAYRDYVKVRNEVEGTLTRGSAGMDYYLSHEADYLAQQLGGHYGRDLEEQQLNLQFGASYGWDAITPLRDDDTRTVADTKQTIHWNAVATRILSPTTLLRWGLEYNVVDGLQHNAYRNVYAGGTHVAEHHPDHRERRDTFLKLNQYVSNRSSLKLSYRLYNDDWGITSHEIGSMLDQYVSRNATVQYQYRYYTQTRSSFYRDEYTTTSGVDGYLSGDYRMNVLASHLFGASLHVDTDALAAVHPLLSRMALWLNYERYFNSNNYSANIFETGLDFRFQ